MNKMKQNTIHMLKISGLANKYSLTKISLNKISNKEFQSK